MPYLEARGPSLADLAAFRSSINCLVLSYTSIPQRSQEILSIRPTIPSRRQIRMMNKPSRKKMDLRFEVIVSFDPTWKPTEAQSPGKGNDAGIRESVSPTPPPAPVAPTIEISEAPSIPVINLPDDKPPTISEMTGSSQDRKKDDSSLPTSPAHYLPVIELPVHP